MKDSKIEWTDHTFNPWWGCTKVSPACDNCYAAALDKRTGGNHWGTGVERRRTSPANWAQPLKWNKNHEAFFKEHGRRQRVFCASMADVFDNKVDPQWRADLFVLIEKTPHLDWLLLTKRIGNANAMLEKAAFDLAQNSAPWLNVWIGATICNQEEADRDIPKLLSVPAVKRFLSIEPMLGTIDLSNWIGDLVCQHCNNLLFEKHDLTANQPRSPTRREYLEVGGLTRSQIRERERGREDEPEVCPICDDYDAELSSMDADYRKNHFDGASIDWVICGGESGNGARPMHLDWARSLRDQCAAADAAFFFKQWGEWMPMPNDLPSLQALPQSAKTAIVKASGSVISPWSPAEIQRGDCVMAKVGKKAAGRLLDGVKWNGVPE